MNQQIDTLKKIRAFLLEGIKDLTAEQLNKIPAGFNNNIIWNLGHLIAAQQGMCYKRANLTPHITDEFWEKFRSGSKPAGYIGADEIAKIKNQFLHTMDELDADFNKGIFGNYTAWTTRYGVEIASIGDALNFLPFHEGLHSGVITTMRKLV
ncbi:MAG: DinB family protein [Bacteroidetes bacterium]|nr:DinB family protein [Bacteroidota bacterium]